MDVQYSQVGLIGLAVMGQNLVLNMLEKGIKVSVYNRSSCRTDEMVKNAKNINKESLLTATYSIEDFLNSLSRPRIIILLVKSGQPVDDFIEQLLPGCTNEDIIVDAGNSNFNDTVARCKKYSQILYCGSGVSGGEEGARNGPSIMPGGDKRAQKHLMPIFEKIAARAGDNSEPCTTWIGPSGSGHFVKMVHNGIEYGDMQIICEAYAFLKSIINLENESISDVFAEWNKGKLKSYLVEITSLILRKRTDDGKNFVIDTILDKAGQKGTGKWTVSSALDLGCPTTVIAESVFARISSSMLGLRQKASQIYNREVNKKAKYSEEDTLKLINMLGQAIFCAKITSYTQGFMLISQASREFGWEIDMPSVARIFRNGCIIRSQFLNDIADAYSRNKSLESLFLDEGYFSGELKDGEASWRKIAVMAIENKVPIPCISNALQFFDSITTERSSANLIQAQRDFFGAHTYETVDNPGVFIHTKWTDAGGDVTSSTYNA